MTLLQAQHLAKNYHSRQVVKDVSLQVSTGEIVGLLGPNGAGKTTSFYMLVGLISCSKGKVLLDNKDITAFSLDERAHLGITYLPQEPSIFRKLTVEQNLLAILELRKDLNVAKRHHLLESLLEEFHLSHVRNSMGFSLSGGERRRVEIARTLTLEPKFILLDEPFAGIDPISVVDLKRIISHLSKHRNVGILISDHNVRETLAICERAYIVNEGQLLYTGNPEQILNNMQVRQVYLGEEFHL
jgi:lipopolysaccharide export system ATP-binding protein